jgi:transcriptional regulator with PAS, ATPase and Fis domain
MSSNAPLSWSPPGEIQPDSLPDFHVEAQLRKGNGPKLTGDSLDDIMANFERDVINSALEQNHFNLARVADQLKITRHALRYRMQRLNISGGTDNNSDDGSPMEKGK